MVNRPLELFEQFRTRKFERVLEAIAADETESEYLDFKEVRAKDSKDPLIDGVIHTGIKSVLAKAMGAFANTHGGIIVWGVESKNNQAPQLRPFPSFDRFARNLQDAAGSALHPPLPGVDHVSFPDLQDPSRGYVVTYVPQSDHRPHMSAGSDQHRYYMRAGSNSEIMPHQIVRDMMIARARPELTLEVGPVSVRSFGFTEIPPGYSDPAGLRSTPGDPMKRAVTATLLLRNTGRANAYDAAFALESRSGHRHLGNPMIQGYEGSSVELTDEFGERFPSLIYPLRTGRTVYPGTAVEVGKVAMEFEEVVRLGTDFASASPLRLRYALYARDFVRFGELFIPNEQILIP